MFRGGENGVSEGSKEVNIVDVVPTDGNKKVQRR